AVAEPPHTRRKRRGLDAMLQQKRQRDTGIVEDAVHGGAYLGAVREHFADAAGARVEAERHRIGPAVVHERGRDAWPAFGKALPAHGAPPRSKLASRARGITAPPSANRAIHSAGNVGNVRYDVPRHVPRRKRL